MAKSTTSKFHAWFVAQHGKRPSKLPAGALMADKNSKRSAANIAERLVDACELWDAKETAALYAWQAAQSGKVSER